MISPAARGQQALPGHPASTRPPNLLLLVADDLGVDRMAAYGLHPFPGHTPVMDALAARGMLFRNCWANPACSPTRATILTGEYSFRTGIGVALHYPTAGIELDPEGSSLAALLAPRYRSAALGKWHLSGQALSGVRHPLLLGFDTFRGSMSILKGFIGDAYYDWEKVVDGVPQASHVYTTTDTVDDALEFVHATTQPWFVWAAFHAPHAPFHKPPPELHSFALPAAVSADIPRHMQAMVEALDTEIGRLLDGLGPELLARTVIILVGDNGTDAQATTAPFLPEHAKNTIYEGGLRVPLVISGPGIASGLECRALVNTTDLFTTCLELAGQQLIEPGDSVSLVPYFQHPDRPSLRAWTFAERFEPNGFSPTSIERAVRKERYKLIRRHTPSDPEDANQEELYDLLADPFEQDDLLSHPAVSPEDQAARQALGAILDQLVVSPPGVAADPIDAAHGPGAPPGGSTTPAPPPQAVPPPQPWLELELDDADNPRALLLHNAPANARSALVLERASDAGGPGAGSDLAPRRRTHVMRLRTDDRGELRWPLPMKQWAMDLKVYALVEHGAGVLRSRSMQLAAWTAGGN